MSKRRQGWPVIEESDLQLWVERIGSTELPILNKTNSYITSSETYLKSHASDIAKAILHDPNMTTKILRLANSVMFNTTQAKINTVSKAVVYLGYDAIRSICFSTAIFEKLVSGKASSRVLSTIANSIHAAVQAKQLADLRKEKNTEEMFIAALLYNIGELSFWCLDVPEGEKIQKMMSAGRSFFEAQKTVLGFDFSELTKALTSEWQISDVLTEALDGEAGFESRGQSIALGYDVVRQIEQGWQSKTGRQLLNSLAEYTGVKDEKKLEEYIKEGSKEAASVMRAFGVAAGLEYIPGTTENKKKQEKLEQKEREQHRSNPKVQVDILTQLTQLHGVEVDVNAVFDLALSGMEKGGGLDRAVAAIKNPKLHTLKGKFVREKSGSGIRDKFDFQITQREDGLYDSVLNKGKILWVKRDNGSIYNQEESQLMLRRLGVEEFFIAPIVLHGKVVGAFYGDRFSGEFTLDQTDFDTFNLFVRQTGICLQSIGDA